MNRNALIALSTAASALAAAATSLLGDENPPSSGAGSTGEPGIAGSTGEPAPKRRGRPPTDPAAEKAAPEEKKSASEWTVETLRAKFQPLVEGGQGEAVKKLIAKYGASVTALKEEDYDKFAKDLDALMM